MFDLTTLEPLVSGQIYRHRSKGYEDHHVLVFWCNYRPAPPATLAVQAGEQFDALVHRIRNSGDKVVEERDGDGSAAISMVCAAAESTHPLLHVVERQEGRNPADVREEPVVREGGYQDLYQ